MESTPSGRRPKRRKRTARAPTHPTPNAFVLDNAAGDGPSRRARFGVLGGDDLEWLKSRAFDLLEGHGIAVVHPVGRAALEKAGAKPASDADRLRLPRELVMEAVAATPGEARLCGKRPGRDIHLPRRDGGFIMRTGTGAHGYVDPDTSAYRNMDLDGVDTLAAVANGLDEVGFIAHPFVGGVPELTSDIHGYARLIARTDKHVWMQPCNKENIEYLIRLAAIAAGGEDELRARPLTSCIVCAFSPLEFKVMDVEVIIQAGAAGLPIHACSLPSAGGTAPISVSGMVLMAAAEILAMVTMAHALAPGTPVIATPLMFTLDMRTGSALQSCTESLQAAGMAIQVMKHGFGLITHTYGAGSDTPDADNQSMAERALLGQTVALAGADILGGVGQLECATVFSPVQAVLDNEVGAMLRRIIQVPGVDDESLNWAEMSAIRTGGHFLDSPHTLKYCRDQLTPRVFRRDGRDDYEASGRRTAFDQAREMCMELIRAPAPEGLPGEDAVGEMAKVVRAADDHILAAASGKKAASEI